MSLQGKPVTEIIEPDLRRLITDRVRESQSLEYKRELYGRADEYIREMLREISAMANALYPGHEVSFELFHNGYIELLLNISEMAGLLYSSLMVDGQEHPVFYASPLIKYLSGLMTSYP